VPHHILDRIQRLAHGRVADGMNVDLQAEIVDLTRFPHWGNTQPQYRNRLVLDAISGASVANKASIQAELRVLRAFYYYQLMDLFGGMPIATTSEVATRPRATRAETFAFIEKERGEGWWGKQGMADYYARHEAGDDPFNWIKGHPLMTPEIIAQYPFDHAGIGETSLMLSMHPEAVDMGRLDDTKWYAASAREATKELGDKGRRLIVEHLRRVLQPRG